MDERRDLHIRGAGEDRSLDEAIGEAAIVNAVQALKGISFPARREDLIQKARENHADESVIQEIGKLRGDRFATATDLFDALADETRGL